MLEEMKKLDRRNFVKSAAVGVASVAFAPAIVKAEQRFRWKLVTSWPPRYPVFQEAAELFAKKVKQATNGRLSFKVFAGGELIPPLGVFDAVSAGNAEAGSSYPGYWAGKIAAAQIFAGVPFGMNAQQSSAWMIAGGGYELWEEVYRPFNLVPLTQGFTGIQGAGWFRKEIKTVADLKGLKIRIPGLAGKVMERAGANVVLMPGGELYTALERGTIDATEWGGPYLDTRLGLERTAPYNYYPGWHEAGGHIELLFNKDAWESLPEDFQAIVRAVSAEVAAWSLATLDSKNSEYLEKLKGNSKVELKVLPKPVVSHLKRLTGEVLKETADNDAQFKKVLSSYQAFQGRVHEWFTIGEQAYMDALS